MALNSWKPITEAPPEDRPILVFLKNDHGAGEYRLCKYFSAFKYIADNEYSAEWGDYDEENDVYYCPEGFYEKSPCHEDIQWWQMTAEDVSRIEAWFDFTLVWRHG